VWSRGLNAALSTVVVPIAYLWARRFGVNAWIAAGIVALSPMMVRHAQMVEPDALVALFAGLAMLFLPRVLEHGTRRDYVVVALLAGLGAASKYTPVLLCVSLYAVHLVRMRREGHALRALGFDDRRLGFAALTAILVFAAASPYTFADLDVLQRDVAYQLMHMSEGHFGHESQGIGYLYYTFTVLPRAIGWPAFVAALAGLAIMVRRRSDEDIAWLAAFVPFYLVMGSLSTQFDRYMLPLVLPMAVSAAVSLDFVMRRAWPESAPRWAGVALAAVACLAMPIQSTARHLNAQGKVSTQQAAADWFAGHADPDTTTIVTERYGPHLLEDPRTTSTYQPVFARLNEEQEHELFDRPFFVYQRIPMYSARSHLTGYYYDLRHYLPYDYVVTSNAVRRRYEKEAQRFPRQNAFYDDLRTYMMPVADFAPGPAYRGPRVTIHRWKKGARKRLLAERGALDVEHYVEWGSDVHAPDFLAFAEQVAVHATAEGDHAHAKVYFLILAETAEQSLRAYWAERAGLAAVNANQIEEGRLIFQQILAEDPRNVVALGNLGFVAESVGRFDEARMWYQRCIEVDTEGTATTWAERRIAGLPDGGGR